MFIVSKVSFSHDLKDAYVSEDGKIKVSVKPADTPKCARCWSHSDTVGTNSEHPAVCDRCAEALS